MSAPGDLPPGWIWATTDDLRAAGERICYGILKAGPHVDSGVPMVRIVDFRKTPLDVSTMKRCHPDRAAKFPRSVLRTGDILVSKDGTIGKVAVVPPDLDGGNITQHVLRVPPSRHVDRDYVVAMLRAPGCQNWMKGEKKGVALQGVNVGDFRVMPIPVAPLNEQRRIVAKTDAVRARSRRAREALDAVPALLDRLRQSVLAAAFRGDLTADWRAKHPDVEPASVLLDRIRAERKVRWIEADVEKIQTRAAAKARKTGKRWGPTEYASTAAAARKKADAKYKVPEPVDAEAEGLPTLPEGWCWAAVEEIADVGTGATPKRGNPRFWANGVVPWVTSTVVNQDVVQEPTELVSQEALRETNLTLYPPGTILLAMYGEGKTRGMATSLGIEATTNQALAALALKGRAAQLQGILLAFLAHNYQEMRRTAAGGVQPNLNLGIVRKLRIPLPPRKEQAVLLDAFGRAEAAIFASGQKVTDAGNRLDTLDQAILAKAFRGELVPQDPDDEPASVLLERIRAEREAAAPKKGRGRRKRA